MVVISALHMCVYLHKGSLSFMFIHKPITFRVLPERDKGKLNEEGVRVIRLLKKPPHEPTIKISAKIELHDLNVSYFTCCIT